MELSVYMSTIISIILVASVTMQFGTYDEPTTPSSPPIMPSSSSSSTTSWPIPTTPVDDYVPEFTTTTTTTTIPFGIRNVLVRNRTVPSVTIPDIIDRRKMNQDYISGLLSSSNMTPTTTTLSYCGGTDLYCSVEYDSTADGKPDCCNENNNPVCAECLSHCIEHCAKDFVGVSTCFVDARVGPICQCTEITPSCYTITGMPAPPSTTQQAYDEPSNNIVYILVLGAIVLTLAAAVHFVYKAGK